MAQNRPPWLRLATQRFDLPARPVPTPIPAATPPQASVPTISPASIPPRAIAPAPVQSRELAPAPAPTATPARAPSPTPALAPVRAQPPPGQVSQPTPSSPALRPAPPAAAATPPRTQPPSPSPPQRQAFQPAPPSPQSRTSPPALAPPQASKSVPASPSPPLQLKRSPSPSQPQSPKTAQPSSLTAPPSPSPVHKPKSILEIVKNQVINPTAAMEVKEADRVVPVKNVPPNSHVAAITDSEKRNHTPPQHSKINEGGNSGPGLHRNRIIPVRDDEDNRTRIIAISGENNGATMEIVAGRRGEHNVANGGEKHNKEAGKNAAAKEGELAKKEPDYRHKPVSAIVNSNVQSVNNSILYGCNCAHNSPGVHLGLRGKPAVFKPRGATDPHSSGPKDPIAGSV